MGTWTMGRGAGPQKNAHVLVYEPSLHIAPAERSKQAANQSGTMIAAYERCFEERRIPGTTAVNCAPIAGVMCAALAVELSFKALIYHEGGDAKKANKNIHNLKELYDMLAEPTRERLTSNSGIERTAFEASLAQIANLFVKIRYYFEDYDTKILIDLEFVRRLILICEMENFTLCPRSSPAPTKLAAATPISLK